MSVPLHHEQIGQVHRPVTMVADATARASASYVASDLYKFFQEEETGTIFQLMALSPVSWRQITDAQPVEHAHDASEITSGTLAYARLPVGTTTATVAAGDDPRMSDARTPVAHIHTAADISSGTLAYARLPVGATAGTVAAGDDPRLSDARTPTAHVHPAGDITSGTLDYARLPVGTTAGTVAAGDDERFSDARTPLGHTHDGADITSGLISRDRIYTMSGATISTTGRPGAVPIPVAGDQAKFLRGDATWQPIAALPAGSDYNVLYYKDGTWQTRSDILFYPVLGTSAYGIKIGGISSNDTMLDIVPVDDKVSLHTAGNGSTVSTVIISNTGSGQALYLNGQSGANALRVGSGNSGFGLGLSRTISATIHGTGSTIIGADTTEVADVALEDNEINIFSNGEYLYIKHKHSGGSITKHILPGAPITGWEFVSGTANRGGFDTATVTLEVLAEHVKALKDDLEIHRLIGLYAP